MTIEEDPKIVLIESYFEDLEDRISFLDVLVSDDRGDEAFLLCSIYIESLANRYYRDFGSTKGFCTALIELSKNELFSYIHPKQLIEKINGNKLFKDNAKDIEVVLNAMNNELQCLEDIKKAIDEKLNEQQKEWLNQYWYKGSMAMIAYERIRCEAVHDIYAVQLSFSESKLNGNPVPDFDFNLFRDALTNIESFLKEKSLREKNLFLQYNA